VVPVEGETELEPYSKPSSLDSLLVLELEEVVLEDLA
jgi:hypothetical protein